MIRQLLETLEQGLFRVLWRRYQRRMDRYWNLATWTMRMSRVKPWGPA